MLIKDAEQGQNAAKTQAESQDINMNAILTESASADDSNYVDTKYTSS